MPDPNSPPPSQAVRTAGRYPIPPVPATPSLKAILLERIAREGPLPFTEFMATALYHPELGYYAREGRQVGRGGDFFTSVSVGPLFGELLARRFLREWETLGSPGRWRIIECGAHDGTLAADILGALSRTSPDAFGALEYAIPEPLPRLQEAQRKTLAGFQQKMRFIGDASELSGEPLPGIAFGNELLDALPFHIIESRNDHWYECHVGIQNEEFTWESHHEIDDPGLLEAVGKLGTRFPDGYRAEIRTNLRDFLESLTRCLTSGLLVWLDYGFARPELYHPDRTKGTLRTFSKHRAAEDPLADIGEIDITAHVDFTAVAEAATSLGAMPAEFKNQGAWLTEIARPWLLSQEGNPDASLLRQFQTLTHPAHLGASFHVIELYWNPTAPAPDPATLAHRLFDT